MGLVGTIYGTYGTHGSLAVHARVAISGALAPLGQVALRVERHWLRRA